MVEIVALDGTRINVSTAEIAALCDAVRGGVILAADAD